MNNDKKSFVQSIIDTNKELLTSTVEITQGLELSAIEKFGKVNTYAKESISDALERVPSPAKPVSIEDIFDNRVSRTLKRLGTPTANALESIGGQLAEISARLKDLDIQEETTTKTVSNKPAVK